MKPHRLVIIALLAVGVALVAAAPGVKAQEACDNPPLVETTLPWPPEIHRAVSRELCRRPGDVLPGAYPNLILTSLDLFEGETWAFATVVMRPDPPSPVYESLLDFDSSLVFAHRSGGEWRITKVEAKNSGGYSSAAHSFQIDTQGPRNPTTIRTTCNAPNNGWQNSCPHPQFIWSGAVDQGCGRLKDYEYRWQETTGSISHTIETGATVTPGFTPQNPVSDGVYKLTLRARDTFDRRSVWSDLFILRYDQTPPTAGVQINNGAETTTQVSVRLSVAAADNLSGADAVRLSHNAVNWTEWQPLAEEIDWALPPLNRRDLPVYAQVRDRAGNESSVVSDTIYLDLYPAIPHSAAYRLCRSVVAAAGSTTLTSAGYRLTTTTGQPFQTGGAAASPNFTHQTGFLSDLTGCPTLTPVTGGYQIIAQMPATGGGSRSSAAYRLNDTAGQVAASEPAGLTGPTYGLTSGFWPQAAAPSTLTTVTLSSPQTPNNSTSPADSDPAVSIFLENPALSLLAVQSTPKTTQTGQAADSRSPGNFTISIDNGEDYTADSSVTVYVSAPNVTHLRLSNRRDYANDNWRPYQITNAWTLSTTTDALQPRYVYAWFKDEEETIYSVYFDSIVYDPAGPAGYLGILGTDVVTNTIGLFIQAWDTNSGVSEMRLSESPDMSLAAWQSYTETTKWPLSNFTAIVYVQFSDYAGNLSEIYQTNEPFVETGGDAVYLPLILKQ